MELGTRGEIARPQPWRGADSNGFTSSTPSPKSHCQVLAEGGEGSNWGHANAGGDQWLCLQVVIFLKSKAKDLEMIITKHLPSLLSQKRWESGDICTGTESY